MSARSHLCCWLPLLAAACAYPRYTASRVVERTLPAAGLERLDCESHNGGIAVTGDPAATEVRLRAELSVRGHTQAEADANLQLLDVVHELAGGTLRVRGTFPEAELANRSPGFRFTMTVPRATALQLRSHNGDLRAEGVAGPVVLATHNGDVTAAVHAPTVDVRTHNGDVDVQLDGGGPLDGEVQSHNGDVRIELGSGIRTTLHATTHNGRVTAPASVEGTATVATKRSFEGRVGGEGGGRLTVTAYNGDVVVR
jgi:hypothetical protein